MRKPYSKMFQTLFFMAVFSIAMGFLEAIVVVYVRHLYYPSGFDFPLSILSPEMIFVEWVREMATIVMLASIGIIAGKNNLQRFFYFLYAFAIWDIIYYVGLILFLNWPPSFFTWDILFLIPTPWIGPVLAPVICSITMLVFGGAGIFIQERGRKMKLRVYQWSLLFFGSFLILYSFMVDYMRLIIQNDFLSGFWGLSGNEHFWQVISQFKPVHFNWIVFSLGELIIMIVVVQVFMHIRKRKHIK